MTFLKAADNLNRDFRFSLRQILRSPGFAAVAILTLGLGIGANAAIFSLVDAIVLRPLPYPNPQQLVGLGQWRNQRGEGYVQTGVSAPNMDDIANQTKIFQQTGYYRWSGFTITEGNRPESLSGIQASAGLLPMFGIQPLMGRLFTPDEMQPGHDQVAIIGHRLWLARYGRAPNILGKTIDLNERRYTIVGVMPAGFRFTWDQEMDVFVPLALTPAERSEAGRGTSRDLQAQARLQAGVSVQQAQAAMNTLAADLAAHYPDADQGWGIKVEPLHAAYHRQMATPLLIMSGSRLLRPADCLRQHRQSAAGAFHRKKTRDGGARGHGGQSATAAHPVAHRKRGAGGDRRTLWASRSPGSGDRLLTLEMTRYHRFSVANAGVIGHRLEGSALLPGRDPRHRDRLWTRPRPGRPRKPTSITR